MTAVEILPLLDSAFVELFDRDCALFTLGTSGISEQTLTFRLGHYLQQRFEKHHVDCEYNRFEDKLKNDIYVDQEWMKPDVIIHWRTKKEQNLLVVEAKKAGQWEGGWASTSQKLEAFTRQPGKYEYRLGLAWQISESQDPRTHLGAWFRKGTEICRTRIYDFVTEVQTNIKAQDGAS